MMKKSLMAVSSLLIITLSTVFFASCDKDTNSTIVVTVVDEQTKKVVQNAKVYFGRDSSDYNVTGYTDVSGRFSHTYPMPAVYEAKATKDYQSKIDDTYYWDIHKEGNTTFRLEEGKTKEITLNLTQSDSVKKIYQ